jgi:Cof subfamily protein (haloacid dehalogenase superfamily)/HAD superfamily hydrolase (TIGR01509 family)
MSIKLLIADVDGTLVTSQKTLTARTRDAVARLRAAGVDFTITSGRPPRGMAMLIEPLHLTAPVAAFNGGMYVRASDLTEVLMQKTISPDAAEEAVSYLLRAGLDVWVYRGTEWYVRSLDAPRIARERNNVGFDPILTDDLRPLLDAAVKIVGVSMDLPLVERCEADLSKRLATTASAARSQPYYLDITHPEANKGMVVREAARILRLSLDQIATIGDMSNDISMLSVAGMGIAMGNSSPEVQRAARHVTTSNDEDGFAHAVDSFILGEPPLAKPFLGLPPRTRACVFGLDGVLTQSARFHAQAWKRVFDPYLRQRDECSGQPFVPFDAAVDVDRHFRSRSALDGVRAFLETRGIEVPEATMNGLIDRKAQLMTELVRQDRVETYEGSLRYLRAARAAGLRTAVVSQSLTCEDVLRSAGVSDLVNVRIDGALARSEHLVGRPAPDLYLAAAHAVGVEPEQAAVFEDELGGVEAGRAGHFGYVVGIDRGGQAAELRRHGADVVVDDLAALLAA